jgi:type IV pilus assembly protein PilM
LGGNHFTKALTKEMKLTFAKAEHLKRNATAAADPKAVFQAMKPVFNDLLTELQRSISYFGNLDRNAKIGRIVALGNAMKLPGLRKYLSQSLGFEIERVETYNGLTGSQVVSSPIFQENALCFGVCYGLVLQGLGLSGIHTNLLPPEIVKNRLIKRKKPWAVAAAASLLLGCGISFGTYSLGMNTVDKEVWKPATSQATTVIGESGGLKKEYDEAKKSLDDTKLIGTHLVVNVEGRLRWLELLKAIDEALPFDDPKNEPEDITERRTLYITNVECQYAEDVSSWFTGMSKFYSGPEKAGQSSGGAATADAASPTPPAADPAATSASGGGEAASGDGPKDAGWIVKIEGYHYHNNSKFGNDDIGEEYIRKTLINGLQNGTVTLPTADRQKTETVSMKELGISFPVLWKPEIMDKVTIPDPKTASTADAAQAVGGPAVAGAHQPAAAGGESGMITVKRFKFNVQFCWQPKLPSKRQEAKEKTETEKSGDTAAPPAENP